MTKSIDKAIDAVEGLIGGLIEGMKLPALKEMRADFLKRVGEIDAEIERREPGTEEHVSTNLSDAERDVIVKGLTRFGRTITVHDPDDVALAKVLLVRMGFDHEGKPIPAPIEVLVRADGSVVE